jgi:CheY-like chemotaxis protein
VDSEPVVLRFEVEDTGIGIPKNRLDSLFDAFSQADASTTRKYGGTGLGLTISKRLVEMMGGAIGVESEKGRGSRFWFTAVFQLPSPGVVPAKTPPGRTAVPGSLPSPDTRILLVEDNPVNREVLVEEFERHGIRSVLTAENGREGVEMALKHAPHLVLMDIHMPHMDGNEAIRELKQRGYTGPIIALSASAMREDVEKIMAVGAADYITKPVDFDTFLINISGHLPREQLQKRDGADASAAVAPDHQHAVKPGDAAFRIDNSVSMRVRSIFLEDSQKKLDTLSAVTGISVLVERKRDVYEICHGYKGAAGFMGLSVLESAAAEFCRLYEDDESLEKMMESVTKVTRTLERVLAVN